MQRYMGINLGHMGFMWGVPGWVKGLWLTGYRIWGSVVQCLGFRVRGSGLRVM